MTDRRSIVVSVLLATSCGGGSKPAQAPAQPVASPSPSPSPSPIPTPADPAPPPRPDTPPELVAPVWKRVGVGQTISFSTAAIDQDLDQTRVEVTKLPGSAKFDPITQTVTWTPTKGDLPRGTFELTITQPERQSTQTVTWTIDVDPKRQPVPEVEPQSPLIETVLMIHDPKRLAQINKEWPFDRMLLVGAETFRLQLSADKREALGKLDKAKLFESFLAGLAETHQNPRVDPKSPTFDKAVFGDPKAWKIVAVRPRIDRAWTELRVVYRAVKAPEPVFAMFRLRPVVEYAPPAPRPPQERIDNNKVFLGMVAKHLLPNGAPNPRFVKDRAAHGRAVAALMKELMSYDQTAKQPYLHGFSIGIATEARLGGGSARNPDGSYAYGDGWAWAAMKPFPTADGKSQRWVDIVIPGFWTKAVPVKDGTSWGPACADKYVKGAPGYVAGYDALCRKPLGFVDLPDTSSGKVKGSKVEATYLFRDHKLVDSVKELALDDGRRDLGEENGMTCAQCHIRNFGMHDWHDPAATDPSKGVPKAPNKHLATLNFVIIPTDRWEAFTLDFLAHQECRGKQHLEQFLGPDAAKGLGCPLLK